jgi:tripartite-type tricarboxylate transporter receptor subunit TctC
MKKGFGPPHREGIEMKHGFAILLGTLLISALARHDVAHAQESFFKGKQIKIVVGLSTGGGYDRAQRLLAKHLGRYIPGNPDVYVQNMPGAGSVSAANYVWGVAKPDGLTLLAPHNNLYLSQLSGQKEVQFDLPKFHWIGSLENDDMLLFGRADAPFKSMSEIVRSKQAPKCGSTGIGSSDYVVSKILNETIGARIEHITGYPGSSEIALALERGEVQCMGLTIATYFSREPFLSWQKTKFIRFLAQSGHTRQERLADAPTIYELMDEFKTSATKRRVAEAMLLGGEWARSVMVAPATPTDRVATLRAAFDKAVKDADLLAEAKKFRIDVVPARGEQLQKMVKEVMVQPPEVIEQIKKLFVQ